LCLPLFAGLTCSGRSWPSGPTRPICRFTQHRLFEQVRLDICCQHHATPVVAFSQLWAIWPYT
jgi:hypothetical protein